MRRMCLLVALVAAGCPGLGQVGFDVDSQGSATITGSPLGGVLPPASFGQFSNMNFSQSQSFQNNNTDKDHISSARVSKLTLKVTSPSGANLNFLRTIEFDIAAQGLPTVKIAEAASIAAGLTQLDLTIPDQEIAPYAKASSFSITTKATGQQPAQDTTLEADLTLHIVANVL